MNSRKIEYHWNKEWALFKRQTSSHKNRKENGFVERKNKMKRLYFTCKLREKYACVNKKNRVYEIRKEGMFACKLKKIMMRKIKKNNQILNDMQELLVQNKKKEVSMRSIRQYTFYFLKEKIKEMRMSRKMV